MVSRGARSLALALLTLLAFAPDAAWAQEGGQPDLVPVRLTSRPVNLTEGANVTFDLEVQNIGNASSERANVTFFLDGEVLGNASLAPLANGTASNVTSPPWNATLGNHTVSATVDPEGALEEGDETNNDIQLAVRVEPPPPPLPDLMVLDVGPLGDATLGQNVTFQARLLNAGEGDAGTFGVRFDLDGEVLGNATLTGLPAGQGATVEGPTWVATGGNHTVRAVADAGKDVEETDEDNNEFSRPFVAAPPRFAGPDLRVSEVVMEPEHPAAGMAVTFRALVENPGEASGPFLVVFTLDNRTFDSKRVAALGEGDSIVVDSTAWNATAGSHELLVEADPGPGNDTALLNNALPFRFRIPSRAERPDLVLDLLVLPAIIASGDEVRPAAVVRNNGTFASNAAAVRFAADGKSLGDVPLPSLEPGATTRVTGPVWKASLGLHVLQARADPQGVVSELREDNNAQVRNVTVPQGVVANVSGLPDLAVAKFSWTPLEPKLGDDVVLRVLVRNLGNGTVGPFGVEFTIDGQVYDQERVTGIGTVDIVVLSRPWDAKGGRHTLGVRLDPADAHEEQEEANNIAYGIVEVAPPGLPFARSVPGPAPFIAVLAALAMAAVLRRRR